MTPRLAALPPTSALASASVPSCGGVEGVGVGHRTRGSAGPGSGGRPRRWSARQTRSGVSGRSRMTTPVASRTAAATAGATHSSAPSLMPFDAVRARAVLVLDDVAVHARAAGPCSSGSGSRSRPRFRIRPVVVVDVVLHQRVAEAHDRGALVLARTWSGLSALPTSETVTWRATTMSPVSRSTSASTAVQLNSKNAARPAERVVRARPPCASRRLPMSSPPSRPRPRLRTSRIGQTRGRRRRTTPRSTTIVGLVDRRRAARPSPGACAWMSRQAREDRVAHEHGRAAGRGLLVVRARRPCRP